MLSHNKTCPLCESASQVFLSSRDYNRQTTPQTFIYHRCGACDYLFLPSIPENLGAYYSQDYHHLPSSTAHLTHHFWGEKFKVDIISEFIQEGRLLDIGPSVGGFLYLAKEAGFDVEALEMDPRCCQFLRDELKIPTMESGDIVHSLQEKNRYDIITLWQVIEHLEKPWKDLKAIIEALKPQGYLVIAAPNPHSFQFKIFGHRWTHLDAPRHLTLPSIPLLQSFLSPLGMETVFCTTKDKGSLDWNTFGWHYSLSHLLSSSPQRRMMRYLGRAFSMFFSPIEKIEGLGSCFTLVLKKGLT